MGNKRVLDFVVAGTLLVSSSAWATNGVPDARGIAMGGTGVASADYLLAPFYNPALVAVYRDNDDIGLLLPGIGVSAQDKDDTLSEVDDLQDIIDDFNQGGLSAEVENADELNEYLNRLSDNKATHVSAHVGAALAIPMNAVSLNFFTKGDAELKAKPNIAPDLGPVPAVVKNRYENSSVDLTAFANIEFGLAIAKRFSISGQDIAIGLSPKIQQLHTYQDSASVEDFDIDDYDESEEKKSTFNMDLGAVWMINDFRVGVAAKDLFSQSIDTQDGTDTYKLDTQVTVSAAYVTPFFTAALDADVTKKKRFLGDDDDTQYVRFGIEGNAWGWAQLRAGYAIDLQDNMDNAVTAGIGISPGDVVSLDIGGSYANAQQMGVAANLAFTF